MALRLDHQPNGLADVDIQRALLDQVAVHCGVKPAVVHNIVDMAIHIVVGPAGGDGLEDPVMVTGQWCWPTRRSWTGCCGVGWVHGR